ncbi:uncharacterized protein LOC129853936 [Salvelinus fontinalis]|uniref:uncharacterized protein LOC129853936 n=1 Tax=Salvelinus fontinalis TaxID=8038 RepID=UPI002485E4C0|nr:uncharacterized protein LOC129853936 [Salvelinus fontinalis]
MDRRNNVRGRVRMRGGRRGGGQERGRRRGRQRVEISDEIRATVIDHVLVHGLTMREAGLRVQPNLSLFSVSTIVRTFREENRIARLPHAGGRTAIFTREQEAVIVGMVLQDNAIRLREIQERVIQDNTHFQGIDSVSISTIDRVLLRNRMRMKQVYRVPFERNSPRVKELRAQYVQTIFDLESLDRPHKFIFVDDAGFNLTKRRRRGRNMIGQRAIVEVPGQRGGNVTICAAISNHGVLHHRVTLGPYNTQHLLRFIANLRDILFEQQVQEQQGQVLNENPIPTYVIMSVSTELLR